MLECLHKNLYLNVHSTLIHDSKELETTQMSFDGKTIKHTLVLAHHGTLLSNEE